MSATPKVPAAGAALPTFFVIGAAKCGTSSLHHYLGLHPEISMTSVKEPQVFASADYRAALDRYAPLFGQDADVRGESSAVYSQYPRWWGIPERIHSVRPDARFVYMVGDPIDRVVAHYGQRVLNGGEDRSLDEALMDMERHDSLYVCASRYATQIKEYLRWFPSSRMLVVDQDDLHHRREATLAKVFAFLAVDAAFRSDRFDERVNTREDHRLPTAVGSRLRGTRFFQRARLMPIPGPVRRPIRRLASRRLERPALDERLRGRLMELLEEEVRWLRQFTGRDFSGWSL